MRQPVDELNRRAFLGLTGAAGGLTALAGCDLLSTDPAGDEGAGQSDAGYGRKEAPMLAERADAGELPPLAERLPKEPLVVVDPAAEVGRYGGTLTYATGGEPGAFLYVNSGYDNLVHWKHWSPDWNGETIPNVAKSVEVEADGQVYVFRLRDGMKWSDGEPFTADDIIFAIDDVLLNPELYPVSPSWMTSGGEPLKAEKVDDLTVRISFARPNGLFLQRLATPDGHGVVHCPKHYLSTFHKTYNPEVDQLAQEANLDDWVDLFFARGGPGNWGSVRQPTLQAWVLTEPWGGGSERVSLERNPYYWKVDTQENQLPYIDSIVYQIYNTDENMLLGALNGDIDLEFHRVTTNRNKPVLARDRDRGDYRFFEFVSGYMNYMTISLNLTHRDPVKREVFNNLDFRIGLSHAINRQEVIDIVFQSFGEPWQAAPRPESVFFDEEFAKQYTEYDPDAANRHLDQAGFVERDSEGFRLGPDGKRISFAMEVASDFDALWVDTVELVQGYWRDVGVDLAIKNEGRSLFDERLEANEHDAGVWLGDGGHWDALLDPRFYFPSEPYVYSLYAEPWADWYNSGGEAGDRPPETVRRQMELYDGLKESVDRDQQIATMKEILAVAKEQFYAMGIALQPTSYGIIKNSLRNLPDELIRVWLHADFGPSNPCQFFFADDQ